MKSIVADTNIFLRFFLDDVPEQKIITEKLLQRAKDKEIRIIVPQIIIFEISFILEKGYHFPKEQVIDKLNAIISAEYLQIESRDIFISALTIYKSANVSLTDCFLFAKAKAENAELFTFDKKLKKLP